MIDYPAPKLIISKCLGFAHCYYSGQRFDIKFLKKLEDFVEYYPLCPEVEIGLPVPRQTLRLVEEGKEIRLRQPATGADLTDKLKDMALEFFEKNKEIDGFICKEGSPSCGCKSVKLYPALKDVAPHKKTEGIFARAVFDYYGKIPAENDGRLNNLQLREDFLTAIFTMARFRKVEKSFKIKDLIDFHTRHKYQLMALSPKNLKVMGRLTANNQELKPEELIKEYKKLLKDTLNRTSKPGLQQNVLNHCFGYVSDKLKKEEIEFFIKTVEKYRKGMVPLSVPLYLLNGWIIEQQVDYLSDQTYFKPFPEELIDQTDSGRKHKLD
ncbi:MAG: YbgA family protein [Bacillota bacterium]